MLASQGLLDLARQLREILACHRGKGGQLHEILAGRGSPSAGWRLLSSAQWPFHPVLDNEDVSFLCLLP